MDEISERMRRIRYIVTDVDGVLTDGLLWFDGDGRPFRSMSVRDGTGLTLWREAGGRVAIMSGLGSPAVEAVGRQWRIEEVHMHVKNKTRKCRELSERAAIALDAFAFVGDDIIDMRAMRNVGLAVAPADASPQVRSFAHVVTKARGGHGCVRELVERLLTAQGRLSEIVDQYCDRKDGDEDGSQ